MERVKKQVSSHEMLVPLYMFEGSQNTQVSIIGSY